jgi:hypothetical protein
MDKITISRNRLFIDLKTQIEDTLSPEFDEILKGQFWFQTSN